MKTLFFLMLFVLFDSALQAQSVPPPPSRVVNKIGPPVSQGTPPPPTSTPQKPPPPPASSSATNNATTPAPEYKLSSVRVKLQTGDDNKEAPSGVWLILLNKGVWLYEQRFTNEIKSNAAMEFGMQPSHFSKPENM